MLITNLKELWSQKGGNFIGTSVSEPHTSAFNHSSVYSIYGSMSTRVCTLATVNGHVAIASLYRIDSAVEKSLRASDGDGRKRKYTTTFTAAYLPSWLG